MKHSPRSASRSSGGWRVPLLVLLITAAVSAWSLQQVYAMQRLVADRRAGRVSIPGRAANTAEQEADMTHTLDAIDAMNRLVPPPAPLTDAVCHTVDKAEYDGTVLTWGSDHFKPTAFACCRACTLNPECNAWVWCGQEDGCGGGRKLHECWLKKAEVQGLMEQVRRTDWTTLWTSGALYSDSVRSKLSLKNTMRRRKLQEDTQLPLVFLDIEIRGHPAGRIVVALLAHESPRAAENFRRLCTGERGKVPAGRHGEGKALHLKGAPFYRIISGFINQAGIDTDSALGGHFKDDAAGLRLRHDRKGLLSMANGGVDTNTAHFSILLGPAPHLDGHYTIFGEVVEGLDIVDAVNALARGRPDNKAGAEAGVVIADCGQLRAGTVAFAA